MQARYTVVLKELMDNEQTKAALSTALSTYPLYQPKTLIDIIPERSELNKRLLNAYKYREIGFETVGRFLDELEIVMCEIMPYYNEMYKTIEIMAGIEDPFGNVDFTETYRETRSGTSTNEAQSNASSTDISNSDTKAANNSKSVHAATPQSELSIPAANIDEVGYADDVTWNQNNDSGSVETTSENESSSNSNSTNTTSGTTEHTYQKKGNQGVNTYAHDMNEFRTSIIDVTNQIITDERISELFMRVF